MRFVQGKTRFCQRKDSVVTLGKFDGVHKGHQKLIKTMEREKGGMESLVFTFDIPPIPQNSGNPQAVLTTNQERAALLSGLGVDILIECPFVPEISGMEPELFLEEILIKQLKCREIFVGPDFHFGHRRKGDVDFLLSRQKQYGYRLTVVEKACQDGVEISSTEIRSRLSEGRLKEANEMLGRPYFFSGEVIHGNHLGRTIGFPTANISVKTQKVLLPFGVYAVTFKTEGKAYPAIANIGRKPTIKNYSGEITPIGVETHLLDFEGNLYGKEAQVDFHAFVRPERQFPNMEALQREIQANEIQARNFFQQSVDK